MTLLIYHHPGERKQTRIPKDKEGVSGKSQRHFSHLMAIQTLTSPQLVQYVQITRQKLHSNVAQQKQIPDIEIPAHQSPRLRNYFDYASQSFSNPN